MGRKTPTIRRMQTALKENNVDDMREAIADGAYLDRCDRDGNPYLVMAMIYRHYAVAKLLIESAADVNHTGKNNVTALGRAVSSGNLELVRMLIEHGAYVNVAETSVKYTPLHYACLTEVRVKKHYTEEVRTNIVSMLIKAGADVNARDKRGCTALHWACRWGYPQTARLLLDAGADPAATADPKTMSYFADKTPLDVVIELRDGNPAKEELIELFQQYAPEQVFRKFCTMSAAPGM